MTYAQFTAGESSWRVCAGAAWNAGLGIRVTLATARNGSHLPAHCCSAALAALP